MLFLRETFGCIYRPSDNAVVQGSAIPSFKFSDALGVVDFAILGVFALMGVCAFSLVLEGLCGIVKGSRRAEEIFELPPT
jgi:hypothetical protein